MERIDNRKVDEIRPVKITPNYLLHPDGSVLIEMGLTKVICTAMVEEKVPPFLKGKDSGWVTAEYSMMPGSTQQRKIRAAAKGKIDGRSQEIQRLIGRSLRSIVELDKLGERTIWIDCDVIQADGGTRTASITGAYVALMMALEKLKAQELIEEIPVKESVAAISVGIVGECPVLDLCYAEDSTAKVDMNLIMTGDGRFIELQGTGEEAPFTRDELNTMMSYGEKGIRELIQIQNEVLSSVKGE
ncbi:ribonuclease PH [Fusibacter sp. JL216-2]|uniref:ribonuclease PH n=1 Tax=Fusibacter sp. JL216-2 TaxID=3071453 RepID=UPI003D3559DD